MYYLKKASIQFTTVTRKRQESPGVLRIVGSKHPAGSPRRLFRSRTRLENRHFQAAAPQLQGACEANDAAACNRDVPWLPHRFDCKPLR